MITYVLKGFCVELLKQKISFDVELSFFNLKTLKSALPQEVTLQNNTLVK